MKKILFILFLTNFTTYSFSQNVGVGTITPAEKLDVNGNINISGNIKINGTAGQNNQVITTNSQGQTVWGEMGSQYKNVMTFSQSGVWNIPPGVTNIMVEAWGAGGGGAAGGGGGSGVYLRMINVTVTPGSSITVTIGTGGAGAINSGTNATDGGNTVLLFSQNGFNYSAPGGFGGRANGPGPAKTIGGTPAANLIYFAGNGGQVTNEEYNQISATEFAKATNYGNGGNSPFLNMGGGQGGFTNFNVTNSITLRRLPGTVGSAPGAGGGGGEDSSGNFGSSGHPGFVLIWY
jgi:hypothetical protein